MPDAFERHGLGRDEPDEDGAEATDAADAADDGIGDETPGPAPDREWTDEVKALIVRECSWPGTRPGEVARRYGLSANQVNAWRVGASSHRRFRRRRKPRRRRRRSGRWPLARSRARRALPRLRGRRRRSPRSR